MIVGYVRVSTDERGWSGLGLAAQHAEILDRFPDAEIHEEVASGKRAENRPELAAIRRALRRGDTLVVAKLDRLTRSIADFGRIIEEAQRRGWALVVLDQALDTSTANGRLVANVLASVAQWEREMIGERTAAALRAKRATGWEHPHALPDSFKRRVRALHARGLSQRKIAAKLGTHKETVRRILATA